uniref:Uncharacterized protein n=1 Tax=Arundo donax TaxID=35708 RepID=A0A0A9D4D5_ARUDO
MRTLARVKGPNPEIVDNSLLSPSYGDGIVDTSSTDGTDIVHISSSFCRHTFPSTILRASITTRFARYPRLQRLAKKSSSRLDNSSGVGKSPMQSSKRGALLKLSTKGSKESHVTPVSLATEGKLDKCSFVSECVRSLLVLLASLGSSDLSSANLVSSLTRTLCFLMRFLLRSLIGGVLDRNSSIPDECFSSD